MEGFLTSTTGSLSFIDSGIVMMVLWALFRVWVYLSEKKNPLWQLPMFLLVFSFSLSLFFNPQAFKGSSIFTGHIIKDLTKKQNNRFNTSNTDFFILYFNGTYLFKEVHTKNSAGIVEIREEVSDYIKCGDLTIKQCFKNVIETYKAKENNLTAENH